MSKPDFLYVTYIETTPERLWQALTDSSFTRQYWWGTSLETDWKVGSPIALVMDGTTTDTGQILACDPPRLLSYSFHHEIIEAARKEKPSTVTMKLEPHGKLVKLTVTHDGFPEGSVALPNISKGWPAILSGLKSLLETGKTSAVPFEALGIELG